MRGSDTRDWCFYATSRAAWEAMIEVLSGAKHCIDFEQYILTDDEIGQRFIEILLEKAKQGLRVRLLCDQVGSISFLTSSWPERLREAKVQVRVFNPIALTKLHRAPLWSHRDHRKVLVVDSEVAFIGGVGCDATMAEWRDVHAKLEGPIVADVERAFRNLWYYRLVEAIPAIAPDPAASAFRLVTNAPKWRRHYIYREMLAAVMRAERYLYLATPYFIPPRRFFREMRRAARRGVDVRLLVPRQSDRSFVDYVAKSHYAVGLRDRVRIYLYRDAMMHAKYLIADDRWASLGSSNLDYRSFFTNYEINLMASDRSFVAGIKSQFLADLKMAEEVTADGWKGRYRIERAIGYAGRLVKKFL